MADKMPRRQTVLETVLTAAYGMTAPGTSATSRPTRTAPGLSSTGSG